jgi:8-oxo-dGTP pyrophosphatase MutT (NUDIX family)
VPVQGRLDALLKLIFLPLCVLTMCRVLHCKTCKPTAAHYCCCCKTVDVQHFSRCCGKHKVCGQKCKPCDLKGCTYCSGNDQHVCMECGTLNTHLDRNCPLRKLDEDKKDDSAEEISTLDLLALAAAAPKAAAPKVCVPKTYFQTEKKHVAGVVAVRMIDGDLHVLVQNRFDGSWGLPGGSAENKEDALTCALRESSEETGYDFTKLEAIDVISGSSYTLELYNFVVPMPLTKWTPKPNADNPNFWESPEDAVLNACGVRAMVGHYWINQSTYSATVRAATKGDGRSKLVPLCKSAIDYVFKTWKKGGF